MTSLVLCSETINTRVFFFSSKNAEDSENISTGRPTHVTVKKTRVANKGPNNFLKKPVADYLDMPAQGASHTAFDAVDLDAATFRQVHILRRVKNAERPPYPTESG